MQKQTMNGIVMPSTSNNVLSVLHEKEGVFMSPYLSTAGGRHLLASFALISYSLSLPHTASIWPTVVETVVSTITKEPPLTTTTVLL